MDIPPRDQAIKIASYFLSKLFSRVWLPWTATEQKLVERLIDCIITAAAAQAQASNDGAVLLDELMQSERPAARPTPPARETHPASRQTMNLRRDDFADDANSDPGYQAFRQRTDRQQVQGMLKREGQR